MNENNIDINPKFVALASDKYKKLWESLNNSQRALIENQASLRDIDNSAQADKFFETRDFDVKTMSNTFVVKMPEKINESFDDPVTLAMKRLK